MTRTQIYLPQSQLRELKKTAAERNTSVSETIRQLLGEHFEAKHPRKKVQAKPAGELLLEMADYVNKKWKKKAPSDLAENMDKYLYGEI